MSSDLCRRNPNGPRPVAPPADALLRHADRIDQRAASGSNASRADMARLAAQYRALAVQAEEVADWTEIGMAARAWSPSPDAAAVYVFYPRREDGSALTFETCRCTHDGEALARAGDVLREHRSAVEVVVWLGDRCIGTHRRVLVDVARRTTSGGDGKADNISLSEMT